MDIHHWEWLRELGTCKQAQAGVCTGGRVSGHGTCSRRHPWGAVVCVPLLWALQVFACEAVSRRKLGMGVRTLSLGREGAGRWPGGGRACHLDADEEDLDGGEDELQPRLAVDVAHVVAHAEDAEADGAAAEEQQGAWRGRAAMGTSGLPTSSTYPAPQYSPRTQMDPA